MDLFDEIADERRCLADQLAGLTADQQNTQSLCEAWTVGDVVAHLVMPMEVPTYKFAVAMLMAAGNFDRANQRLTAQQAQRPFGELVQILRAKADVKFTPPGEGPKAPLTDVIIHGLDIRKPLQIAYRMPEQRLNVVLNTLAKAPKGIVPRGALQGLRFQATDIDWSHGSGPSVTGTSDSLLLALTGRIAGLADLSGEGAAGFAARISGQQVTSRP